MRYLSSVLCCALLILTSQIGKAQTTTNDLSTFNLLSGLVGLKSPQSVNFDSSTVGSSVSGVNFNTPTTSSTTGLSIVGSAGASSLTIQTGNTTTSGSNYLGGSATGVLIPITNSITFTSTDKPLSAFGINLMSTSAESFKLTGTSVGGNFTATSGTATASGGVFTYFLGFTDTAAVYTSVTLNVTAGSDFWIDDVRYTAAPAPELHFIVAIAAAFLLTLKCFMGRIGLGVL